MTYVVINSRYSDEDNIVGVFEADSEGDVLQYVVDFSYVDQSEVDDLIIEETNYVRIN